MIFNTTIFNIPILAIKRTKDEKTICFLNGLLKVVKKESYDLVDSEQTIFLSWFPIYKTIRKRQHKKTYIAGVKVSDEKNSITAFEKEKLDKIISLVPPETEQINVFSCPLGECYLLANLYPHIMKMSPKNLVNLTSKKFTKEIFDIYCSEKVQFKHNIDYETSILKYKYYRYKDKIIKAYISGDDFFHEFWRSDKHILDALKEHLNITGDINFNKPQITTEQTIKLEKKLKSINMSDKFIFISPEARSIKEINFTFWKQIVLELNKKGYDVFLNIHDKSKKIKGTKTIELNLAESYILAQKAKAIIGLRSGFLELLSQNDVPFFVIYNDVHINSMVKLPDFINSYTLKKYPGTHPEKIYEYNYTKDTQNQILQDIINNL